MCTFQSEPPCLSKRPTSAERVEKEKVRRNLFGPTDHLLAEKFLAKELALMTERCIKEWDFNFVDDVPLQGGRFVWEPVTPTEEKSIDELEVPFDCIKSCKRRRSWRESRCTSRKTPVLSKTTSSPRKSSGRQRVKSTRGAASADGCKPCLRSTLKGYYPVKKLPCEKRTSDLCKKPKSVPKRASRSARKLSGRRLCGARSKRQKRTTLHSKATDKFLFQL